MEETRSMNEIEQTSLVRNSTQNPIDSFKLFVAGYLYDQNTTFQELPKDMIYVICTIARLEFVFESAFDQKGILSWFRNARTPKIDIENIFCFSKGGDDDFIDYFDSCENDSDMKDKVTQSDSVLVLGQNIQEGLFFSNENETHEYIMIFNYSKRVLVLSHFPAIAYVLGLTIVYLLSSMVPMTGLFGIVFQSFILKRLNLEAHQR